MSHRLSKTGIRHLSSTHTRGSELCFYWHGRVLGFYKITSSAFYRCRCVSSQVTLSRRFSWIHKKLFFPFFVFPYVLPALFIWSLKYAFFFLALVICLYHMTNCPHLERVGKRQQCSTFPVLNLLQQLTDMN